MTLREKRTLAKFAAGAGKAWELDVQRSAGMTHIGIRPIARHEGLHPTIRKGLIAWALILVGAFVVSVV